MAPSTAPKTAEGKGESIMNSTAENPNRENRKTAIIVGVLFIIATAFLFIGGAIYNPFLESADYLVLTYPNRTTVVIGILLELACVVAIPLIPVFLFPILRKHNEQLALGYVGFRFLEAVLFIATEINRLALIDASRGYLSSEGTDASYFYNLGGSIQAENLWVFSIYVLVFAIGALIFYSVLYKSKLVPRFISAWGFIAAALILTGTVLSMFEVTLLSLGVVFELIFAAPIAVNEMVLAIWLILKGFNSPAIASQSAT